MNRITFNVPEVKYTLVLLSLYGAVDFSSRVLNFNQDSSAAKSDAFAVIQVPVPRDLSESLNELVKQLQPKTVEVVTTSTPTVDPSAGQLGELQVSLKAVFRKERQLWALLRVTDSTGSHFKTLRQGEQINEFALVGLTQEQAVFSAIGAPVPKEQRPAKGQDEQSEQFEPLAPEQQVTLKLFKNNAPAAATTAQGN